MNFTSQQLLRAMSPIDMVICKFIEEEKANLSSSNGDDNVDVWSTQSQGRFATLIASISENSPDLIQEDVDVDWGSIIFLPSEKYVQKVVKRYTTHLDLVGSELEDNLASLVCHFSMSRISNIPDPTESCILTYPVPLGGKVHSQKKEDLLRIRAYPHHNDVGVAKVWEAGACLAEYILHNPGCVQRRNVIELGAGVGLTSLVAAAAGAESVHMTDYTQATLNNLQYNASINSRWLEVRGVDSAIVSVGKLEWGEFDNDCHCLNYADMLIAGDVVYARECIPDLVDTVIKFLSSGSRVNNSKVALFATTHRNRSTFQLFETELEKKGIICKHIISHDTMYIFPCYFNQPRSDVRLCTMALMSK